ncbi:MAG: RusA family crossover junction endodeoxyribonuclease [Nitrospirae bacterium]|nr:MAG: RusA family crossover junction endodeoxyribonuclease [Nitrospirota bacterium]
MSGGAASFSLSLPLPPSVNHQYATVRGRRILSAQGRRYKATLAHMVSATLLHLPERRTLLQALQTHYLSLSLNLYLPSLLRPDIDAGLKITQDAICEALSLNDNRIVEVHLYKRQDLQNPRMECVLAIVPSIPVPPPKRPLSHRRTSRLHAPISQKLFPRLQE